MKTREAFDPVEFRPSLDTLREDYPIIEPKNRVEAHLRFAPEPERSQAEVVSEKFIGWFIKSADGLTIGQFRVDGFTLNRLKPYTSWEDLFPRAMRLWEHYESIAKPEFVSRVGVRYINHIPLPAEIADFDEYLTAAPPIPEELPQFMSGFTSQVVAVDPENELSTIIRQTLETDVKARTMRLLLDIDAFALGELKSSPEIIDRFEALHSAKNRVFFSCLTERTLGMFE